MHAAIHYELMKARAADFHRQAEQDRIARAAIQASRARLRQRSHRARRLPAVLARHVLALLGADSP